MTAVREVAAKVYSIDNQLYSIPQAGAVYLLNEDKKALVDTGPATSLPAVLAGLQSVGCPPEEIDYILITHIHLDHSGGAGSLLQHMPRAKVIAHHRAVKHLIDPARLIASTGAAQGPANIFRNGEVRPIDPARIMAGHDGDRLVLSAGQALTLLETPGHAPHELCIRESRHNGVFVGDAVGHYIDGQTFIVPITPPPSFDYQLYLATLQRLEQLAPALLYFAHSGVGLNVTELLRLAAQKLREREALIARAEAAHQLAEAAVRLAEHICSELNWLKEHNGALYHDWAENDIRTSAIEHVRYYRRLHNIGQS
jgi:glyoxylase-like metal-dependent hydrolase (beta-lactamase superfamily II)